MKLELEKETDHLGKIKYTVWLELHKLLGRTCCKVTESEDEAIEEFDRLSKIITNPKREIIKQIEI